MLKKKMLQMKKGMIGVAAAALAMCCSMPAMAAEEDSENEVIYINGNELDEEDQLEEHVRTLEDGALESGEAMFYDEGVSLLSSGEIYPMNWDIPRNYRLTTSSQYYMKAGQAIKIAVTYSANVTLEIGMIQPDLSFRYVEATAIVDHTFQLTQTGYYRISVWNGNGQTVSTVGAYFLLKYDV
ncbi:MAG: hypothetical protein ACI4C1_04770 [Lachnospiraceae bacterium]